MIIIGIIIILILMALYGNAIKQREEQINKLAEISSILEQI